MDKCLPQGAAWAHKAVREGIALNITQTGASKASGRTGFALVLAVLLGLIGLWLAIGGAWLLWLGGSSYYLPAGIGCLLAAWFYVRGRPDDALLCYLTVFVATCIWALAEVGTEFWPLVPRLVGPAVFAGLVILERLFRRPGTRRLAWGAAAVAAIAFAMFVFSLTRLPATNAVPGSVVAQALPGDDWTAFGRTSAGTRFSPANQINPANVGALKVAWVMHTGDQPSAYPGQKQAHTFEATPLKVGDLVYVCTGHDIVIAVDADTGKQRWRYDPKLNIKGTALLACRGVSYFDDSTGPGVGAGAHSIAGGVASGLNGATQCRSRIIFGTLDARLIALDALTGDPCKGFGIGGSVGLKDGLGVAPDGYYSITSPPAIAQGVAVIGGFVYDGLETKEPSGVIRGYDVISGKLLWSWDSGAIDENRVPSPGEHYTRGSPNSWTVMSADPDLGLVYVPMGNATPDYVGMHRTPEFERYSSSVVALDIRTGKRRWSFQAVHHDLWDYDMGSQPVLFDMPMPGGTSVQALAQPTKQGDIYILDRRSGVPLTQVKERPVVRGNIPTERYAPSQPASVGFPSPVSREVLRESDMWGTTPLDQLLCRIAFRSVDYKGRFTPPSVRGSLQYPSNFGVMDWGSVSIDPVGGTMFVNSSHLPMTLHLVPQSKMASLAASGNNMFSPQRGTPFAANPQTMASPLGIPCNAPPWGKLTAIDLATRTIKWQRPLGTTHDLAPLGIAVPGAPNIAGSVATAGGLLFIGAATDNFLRAFDVMTGKELWRSRLPAGGQAAPMTYVSNRTGRQFVLIAAGGHQLLKTTVGDSLVAYALPVSKTN
jgi:quinoprotein glucose dehydrogenase